MAGNFGDIVTNLTVDKRQFESGLTSVSKDLKKVQGEIATATTLVANGNREAFGTLVTLIQKEEELGLQAKRAADIERVARLEVIAMRNTELHQLAEQEMAERRVNQVRQQRTYIPIPGRGRGMAGGGRLSGTGIAFGLQDAVAGAQYGGAQGVANSLANNLPQIGAELSAVAGRFAQVGGTLGKVAGGVARFAGPIGLVASVGLPLVTAGLTKLYQKMTEGKRVLDGLEERREKGREKVSKADTLEQLRTGSPEAIAAQHDEVVKLEKEIAATREARQSALTGIAVGLKAGEFQSETQKDDLFKQAEEAAKKIEELQAQLNEAKRFENEGLAAQRIKSGVGLEYMGSDATLAQRTEYGIRQARERAERRDAERAEQQRLRNIDDESMQRSILTGFTARRDSLVRQREGMQQSRRSFNLPELATRGNAMDKMIEMVQAKKEAMAESQRKMQIEKLDKQIELLEKLINEVKDAGPGLKPARVG